MFYKGKNVLVAGGAGLVGQSLIRKLLDAGAFVRATQYEVRKIDFAHKNLEVVRCDLMNPAEARPVFKDMEIVFLTASRHGGAKKIKEDASSIILYNLELYVRLIHEAVQSKAARCAFISSSYVYPHTGRPNVEEEGFVGDPPMPTNYGLGWMHRYLETLCKHFHETSQTRFALIRPTAIYGPHDNFDLENCHVIPALIIKAVERMNPYEVWGTGEDRRSFTFVDDFVEGLVLVTEKFPTMEPFNICSSESYTVKDVVSALFRVLDFHPEVRFNTSKPSTMPYKVSDAGRAKARLGWESRFSLEEGLKRTVRWYVNQKNAVGAAAQ